MRFLGEIIYLLDTERFLLGSVASLVIRKDGKDWLLEAEFKGDILSDRYEIYGDVKAVTYNDMKIEECGGFTLQVVVDM